MVRVKSESKWWWGVSRESRSGCGKRVGVIVGRESEWWRGESRKSRRGGGGRVRVVMGRVRKVGEVVGRE